jgi:hypothetical protein
MPHPTPCRRPPAYPAAFACVTFASFRKVTLGRGEKRPARSASRDSRAIQTFLGEGARGRLPPPCVNQCQPGREGELVCQNFPRGKSR